MERMIVEKAVHVPGLRSWRWVMLWNGEVIVDCGHRHRSANGRVDPASQCACRALTYPTD